MDLPWRKDADLDGWIHFHQGTEWVIPLHSLRGGLYSKCSRCKWNFSAWFNKNILGVMFLVIHEASFREHIKDDNIVTNKV